MQSFWQTNENERVSKYEIMSGKKKILYFATENFLFPTKMPLCAFLYEKISYNLRKSFTTFSGSQQSRNFDKVDFTYIFSVKKM